MEESGLAQRRGWGQGVLLPPFPRRLLEGQVCRPCCSGASNSWPPSGSRAGLSFDATPSRLRRQWALYVTSGAAGGRRPPSWARVRPGHTVPLCGAGSCPPRPCGQWGTPRNALPAWGGTVDWQGGLGRWACAGRPQEPPSKGTGRGGARQAPEWPWVAGGQHLHLPGSRGGGEAAKGALPRVTNHPGVPGTRESPLLFSHCPELSTGHGE